MTDGGDFNLNCLFQQICRQVLLPNTTLHCSNSYLSPRVRSVRFLIFICPAETVGLHGPEHDLKLPHLFATDPAAGLCPESDLKLFQFVFVPSRSKRSFHVFSAAVAAAVAAGRAVGAVAVAVAS